MSGMLSSLRKCHLFTGIERTGAGLILASATALAGCSADVSRFDLGYSDGARAQSGSSYGTTGRTASADYGAAGYDRPASGGSSVSRSDLAPMTTAALPPQQPQRAPYAYSGSDNSGQGYDRGYGAAPSYGSGQQQQARGYDGSGASSGGASAYAGSGASAHGPSAYGGSGASGPVAASGDTIEVRPGDTLYSLSRRHGVSVNALKSANGLTSDSLRPGQQLHLPGADTRPPAATVTARPPRENYEVVAVRPTQSAVAEAPSDWTRRYTVRQGDSLYAIARQNGIKLADLERHNGITDSRRVRPGTELRLPARENDGAETMTVAEAAPAEEPAPVPSSAPAAETPAPTPGVVRLGEAPSAPSQPAASRTPQQPTMLNGTGLSGPAPERERVARVETDSASDAVSPASTSNSTAVAGFSKLRWPVTGRVIGGFGPRPDGTHNDGVNLAAPLGTDIHAAESGVVAYAGDELKGYGNLVLLRHDNGWVTAYAHADEILVKRGDRIRRGQVIAKAGRTGQVDQPQVHFELRQGQKPVDPTPFMERL